MTASLLVRPTIHKVEGYIQRVDIRIIGIVYQRTTSLSLLDFQAHRYRLQLLHPSFEHLWSNTQMQCDGSTGDRVLHRSLIDKRDCIFSFGFVEDVRNGSRIILMHILDIHRSLVVLHRPAQFSALKL